jgi:tumor protein p53-inducible protein 3
VREGGRAGDGGQPDGRTGLSRSPVPLGDCYLVGCAAPLPAYREGRCDVKAILIETPGDESVMELGVAADPELVPGSLRIRVAASGINRADLMQRRGMYPPPPGASNILGLECAGKVLEVASNVSGWKPGDRAMALLAGGGYAEQVVVDAGSAMRIPDPLSYPEAAAIPEVFLTVFLNVFQIGGLQKGGALLVHGGGSGIGTAAIQLARAAGARCIVTAGSEEKCRRCLDLGADVAVNYRDGDFAPRVLEATGGQGVDVVLDHIGASYLEGNLQSLAVGGRLVVIGLMGGSKAEIQLAALLGKRLQVIGSTLRARPLDEKRQIVAGFQDRFGAALSSGEIGPVLDRSFPVAQVAEAHRLMEASQHFGKIVLTFDSA